MFRLVDGAVGRVPLGLLRFLVRARFTAKRFQRDAVAHSMMIVVVERTDRLVIVQTRAERVKFLEGLITLKERGIDDLLARLLHLNADGGGKDECHSFFRDAFDLLPSVDMFGHVGDDPRMKTQISIRYVHFALQENVA